MTVENVGAVIAVIAAAVGAIAGVWRLFVEVDAWRRGRREAANPPPPSQGRTS